MGQINTNNYPTVDSLTDTDLLIVENATHGTGTTTPKQLRENAIGTDPLQTTAQTVTGAINELKNSGGLPENPLSIAHGGTGNSAGYIQTGRSTQSALGTGATIEGHNNTGAGTYCHAEGYDNSCGANASYSHVEGQSNSVSGTASHAEGYACSVSGNYSHAGGYYSTVGYQNQTAVGKYNNNKSGTLFEVGNGTGTSARSNAFEVYSDGKTSWDNGSSKFQFTQNNGSDGYYDANGVFHAFGGGSGNTVSKTRYTINSSSWSSSQDVSGLYTYTLALNPTLVGSVNVYVAGSYDYIAPTDANKTNYSYVKRCNLNTSNLILRAYPKPDANFYIWVEGVEGTNGSGTSYETAGNVIQPNGASSGGGISYSTSETLTGDTWIDGKPIYRRVFNIFPLPDNNENTYSFSYSTVIRAWGYLKGNSEYMIPYSYSNNGNDQSIRITFTGGTTMFVYTNFDASWGTEAYAIVEYTKS